MMINPPKPPEGPKPTKAMFTSQFEHKPSTPLPLSPPTPAAPLSLPPPPPSCSSSLQAVASSQDPLLSSASAQSEV